MADRFKEFNEFVATLHHYPMIAGDDLVQRFKAIDAALRRGIAALLSSTHFVEDNLCYYLADIAAGAMKSKLYRGRIVKARHGVGDGVVVGAEDAKILGMGFDLFKLSRTSRDIAPMLVQRILRSMRLQNMTYESILCAFVDVTEQYRGVCDRLAAEQSTLQRQEIDRPKVIKKMQLIVSLINTKEMIESSVGCVDVNHLYGVVATVKREMDQVKSLQQEIFHAYLRAIPRIVRETARTSTDAQDKFQIGSFGLLYAISKFDYRSGAGFPRFARTWIRQRIRHYAKSTGGPLINPSPKIWENSHKINAARSVLKKERGFDAYVADEDIAEKLNWPVKKVKYTQEKISAAYTVTFDGSVLVDNEQVEMEALIPDESTDDIAVLEQQRKVLQQILQSLEPEDRRLVLLHKGAIDLIENDHIRRPEILRELLYQTACKTFFQRALAQRIDMVNSMPLKKENGDEQ